MTNWAGVCCALNFGFWVVNLPLPFLLFGDTPSPLKIWALVTLLLVNLTIVFTGWAFSWFFLTYAAMLSYFGLLHALSGLLSEILTNHAGLSWYVIYLLVFASIVVLGYFLMGIVVIFSLMGIAIDEGETEEYRSSLRFGIGFSQLIVGGSSIYFLLKLLDQDPKIATWSWITFAYIISFWCIFLWFMEKVFFHFVNEDESYENQLWIMTVCYCFIATPIALYCFVTGILKISMGLCSPFLMSFIIYLALMNTPGFIGMILLFFYGLCALVGRCCKKSNHNQSALAGAYQPLVYGNQVPDPQRPSRVEIIVAKNKDIKEDDECAICWDDFKKDQQLMKIKTCQHSFHSNCLSLWTQKSLSCPTCRIKILQVPMQIAQA